jgi:hypothetical protein
MIQMLDVVTMFDVASQNREVARQAHLLNRGVFFFPFIAATFNGRTQTDGYRATSATTTP